MWRIMQATRPLANAPIRKSHIYFSSISLTKSRTRMKLSWTNHFSPCILSSFSTASSSFKTEKEPTKQQIGMSTRKVLLYAMAGNGAITAMKTAAWCKTGSNAMLSEAIHSLVDTGNQGLLLLGFHQAGLAPDKRHQYGYGRAAYFWSLISALGMFTLGAGVIATQGFYSLYDPPLELYYSWETWAVLGASLSIDGYVLHKVIHNMQATKPLGSSLYEHITNMKDPFILAVFLEDSCACMGVVMASAGIGMTILTGNPMWDSLASIGIGGLLTGVAYSLIRLNQRFLLGQAVEPEIEEGIKTLLLNRPAIDKIFSVRSQWVGPSTFSYKAEVDFDGTYLAAKLLESYRPYFLASDDLEDDLPVILAWFAEDITRLVEREVKEVEIEISPYDHRKIYPQAAFIELEPDSKDSETQAIASMNTDSSRRMEKEAMTRAISDLARTLTRGKENE